MLYNEALSAVTLKLNAVSCVSEYVIPNRTDTDDTDAIDSLIRRTIVRINDRWSRMPIWLRVECRCAIVSLVSEVDEFYSFD